MLSMNGLCKVYRTEHIETHALDSLDLHVEQGEFVIVTGPSGAGKSTFLNVAGLLESFSDGEYVLGDNDVSHLSDKECSAIRNKELGFIFQKFNLLEDLSIYRNVEAPLRYRKMPKAQRHAAVEKALKRVGLLTRKDHLPSQLSGGQQQRVAIARAIAGEPKILLADEPTGNLDTQMSREIMDLLTSINKDGCTIIMVTHNDEIAANAERNIHILDGKIVSDSKTES